MKRTALPSFFTARHTEEGMDISLYYETCGQGEALLLLHGNGDDHTFFKGQIAHFAQRFTVFAIDTRGHGKSPMGEKPFLLSQFADDLRDFMDMHGVERAHILGASDGANIAMLFALRYPERMKSLVLNSGNLDPSGLDPAFLEEIRASYETAADTYDAALLRLMLFEPNIEPEALIRITAPTLVIAGDDDLIPEAHTRLIAAHIPNSRLVFLSGTHSVAAEDPEAFNAAVDAFYDAQKC